MGLDTADLNTINTLRASGVPVVVLLVSGRPLDIAAQLANWNALVASWLPGTEGQGVADVLFGVAQPTGKLPMTWMNSASQQPINDGDGKTPLFPYGFGLTYQTGSPNPDPTPTPTPTPMPSAACRVAYSVNDWGGGFGANVSITNTGTTTINGWTLRFGFPGNQRVTQGWEATWTQSANQVTAVNASWNSTINPNATVKIRFNGSYSGANPPPASFTVNNNSCT
jgi:beta-glucosidase